MRRALTLRRVLVTWTILAVVTGLVLGVLAEDAEAECRASNGWFCFDPGVAFIVVAVGVAVAWLVGAGVFGVVWKLGGITKRVWRRH